MLIQRSAHQVHLFLSHPVVGPWPACFPNSETLKYLQESDILQQLPLVYLRIPFLQRTCEVVTTTWIRHGWFHGPKLTEPCTPTCWLLQKHRFSRPTSCMSQEERTRDTRASLRVSTSGVGERTFNKVFHWEETGRLKIISGGTRLGMFCCCTNYQFLWSYHRKYLTEYHRKLFTA